MKVSIITVVYNNQATLDHAIHSVLSQDYPDIEYIIIDGGSTDKTVEIIQSYPDQISQWISEPDQGIFDAMNKGIKLATGDIIGILNSDDFYADDQVISRVVAEFKTKQVDSVFADLVFVKPDNLNQVVRYYSSANFHPDRFAWGWMQAHPTFFVKREIYQKYDLFKTDYQIAADYELSIRFLAKHQISYSYIPQVLVKMRTGGVSNRTLFSNWILNQEIVRGCRENGIETNMFKVLSKYPQKIFMQLLRKPK